MIGAANDDKEAGSCQDFNLKADNIGSDNYLMAAGLKVKARVGMPAGMSYPINRHIERHLHYWKIGASYEEDGPDNLLFLMGERGGCRRNHHCDGDPAPPGKLPTAAP